MNHDNAKSLSAEEEKGGGEGEGKEAEKDVVESHEEQTCRLLMDYRIFENCI